MSRIPTYVAGGNIDSGRGTLVQPRADTSIGDALKAIGGTLKKIEDETALERENTELALKVAEAQTTYPERLRQIQLDAPEDGRGTFDSVNQDYANFSKDLVSTASPAIRERLKARLAGIGINYSLQAGRFEATAVSTKAEKDLGVALNVHLNTIQSNPTSFDTSLEQGEIAIREAANLNDAQKRVLLDAFKTNAQVIRLQRQIKDNPEKALRSLGGGTSTLKSLLPALIQQESGGRSSATSPKGAIGIMQIMPATARQIARELGLSEVAKLSGRKLEKWLRDPKNNMRLGTFYLGKQLRKYGNNPVLALAAYNAGPGEVDKWIKRFGDPRTGEISSEEFARKIPFKETRNYVASIVRMSGIDAEGAGMLAPGLENLPVETRQKLQLQAEGAIDATAKAELDAFDTAEGQASTLLNAQRDDLMRTVFDLHASNADPAQLNPLIESLRDKVTPSQYKGLLKLTDPESDEAKDDRSSVMEIEQLLESDPQEAADRALQYFGNGKLKGSTLSRFRNTARRLVDDRRPDNAFKRSRDRIRSALDPGIASTDTTARFRMSEALRAFDDFAGDGQRQDDELATRAEEIIRQFQLFDLQQMKHLIPLPRFHSFDRNISDPDKLRQELVKAGKALKNRSGLTRSEIAAEARIINRWREYGDRLQAAPKDARN